MLSGEVFLVVGETPENFRIQGCQLIIRGILLVSRGKWSKILETTGKYLGLRAKEYLEIRVNAREFLKLSVMSLASGYDLLGGDFCFSSVRTRVN